MKADIRYIVYFIPEQGLYTFYDVYMHRPMRHIHDDEKIAFTTDLTKAHLIVDSLNALGLV